MASNTGASSAAWISATAIVAALSIGGSTYAAPSDPVDDSASVDLLDDAIDALERGDDATYESLVEQVEQGEVWLPGPGLDALFDRDSYNLAYLSDVLASADVDQYDWASDALDYELSALQAIPTDGSSSTLEQADEIADADELGAAMLEILDHRGIVVPEVARAVLRPLDISGAPAPDDTVYEQAIAELDQLHASATASPDTNVVEPQVDEPAPAPSLPTTSGAAQPPEPTPTLAATSSEEPTSSAAATPSAAPASGDDSTMLLLAAMALAVVAIVVGLGTAMRGRKHGQLADIAYTDGLTGLKNRRRMDADVAEQQTRNRPTATLMVDVDHFKRFNDVHGHAMGDEVLRLVGSTLSREFRRTDVPYRYGGEEFCVLLPDTTEAEAMAAGERVRAAIADIDLPIHERVTASVGVSIGPATTIAETIERADSALYLAKERGRNQVALA